MEVNKLGQGLIQSASNDVDTNSIEQNLDIINNSWNDLQESVCINKLFNILKENCKFYMFDHLK